MVKLNYEKLAENFKPHNIKIILIEEAPPPSGEKYFYKIPENYSPINSIEDDISLPATIFNHYFGRRPENSEEYKEFLICLMENGIFLIDMIDEPLKIRDKKEKGGINQTNLKKLFSDDNLCLLKDRIDKLIDQEAKFIFLIARNYKIFWMNKLKEKFSEATFIKWKDFRLNTNEIKDCKVLKPAHTQHISNG